MSPWRSSTAHLLSCCLSDGEAPTQFFRTVHCSSAKLGVDLSFQLHLSVNKQRICSLSCTGTERLMFARLFGTSWDAALPQFCPNNDFQIKPTIRLLMRASQSSQPYCIYEPSNAAFLLVTDQHKHKLICFERSATKKYNKPVMSCYGNVPQSITKQLVTELNKDITGNVLLAQKAVYKEHGEEMDKLKCWERKCSQE